MLFMRSKTKAFYPIETNFISMDNLLHIHHPFYAISEYIIHNLIQSCHDYSCTDENKIP